MATDVFLSHNWGTDEDGRNNHLRVSLVNEQLKLLGYNTWFDSERMVGDIVSQMTEGIDNTKVVIVFLTQKYHDKVIGKNESDNCKLEFMYASRRKTSAKMIAVVMDSCMRKTANWYGAIGMHLAGKMFIDMSGDFNDTEYINSQIQSMVKELHAMGVQALNVDGKTDVQTEDQNCGLHQNDMLLSSKNGFDSDSLGHKIMKGDDTPEVSYKKETTGLISIEKCDSASHEIVKDDDDTPEISDEEERIETISFEECRKIISLPYEDYLSKLEDVKDFDCFSYLLYLVHSSSTKVSDDSKKKEHIWSNLKNTPLIPMAFLIRHDYIDVFKEMLYDSQMYWNLDEWKKLFDIDYPEEIQIISQHIVAIESVTREVVRFLVFHNSLDELKTFSITELKKLISQDNKLLWYCLHFEFQQLFKYLITNGANIDYYDDVEGSLLHITIKRTPELVPSMLPICLHHIQISDKYGNTPLHYCVDDSYLEIAKLLIKHGASPNTFNLIGCTPLHMILKPGKSFDSTNKKIYEYLVSVGGNVSQMNNSGLFPGDHTFKGRIILKGLLVGASGVGKTCLIARYIHNAYKTDYISTIGVDFKIKVINMGEGIDCKILLWDTAGQERFKTLTTSYFRGAQMFIFVVDIVNEKTMEEIFYYVIQIKEEGLTPMVVLAANKSDLQDKREITDRKLKALANWISAVMKTPVSYYCVSSKTNENVQILFNQLIERFYCFNVWERIHQTSNRNLMQCDISTKTVFKAETSGYIKKFSCDDFPSNLPLPTAEALLEQCDIQEYATIQVFLFYWRKILLVLSGYGLFWFRDECSLEPLGYLNVHSIISISTESEESLKIEYYEENVNSYVNFCFEQVESCLSWKKIFLDALSELSRDQDSSRFLSNLKTRSIHDKIPYSGNDEINLSFAKSKTTTGTLDMYMTKSSSILFMRRTVRIQLTLSSFKVYLIEQHGKVHLLLSDSASGFKMVFTPTKHHSIFMSSLSKLVGGECLAGKASEPLLLECFYTAIDNVYYKAQMNAMKYLVNSLESAWERREKLLELDLQSMSVTSQDLVALSHGLKFYPYIEKINLRKIGMKGSGVKYLLKTLESYQSLKFLEIGWNPLDYDGIECDLLSLMKMSHLEEFNCGHTNISPLAVKMIFNGIENHHYLRKLILSFNNIDDTVCLALRQVIESTTNSIEEIQLWNSNITAAGFLHLLDAYINNKDSKLKIDLSSSPKLSEDMINALEYGSYQDKVSLHLLLCGFIKPLWIADSDMLACYCCNINFSLFERRSHCRACGKVFCRRCVAESYPIPFLNKESARVCQKCLQVLKVSSVSTNNIVLSDIHEDVEQSLPSVTKEKAMALSKPVNKVESKSSLIQSKLDEFMDTDSVMLNEFSDNSLTLTQMLKEFLIAQQEVLSEQKKTLDVISKRQVLHYHTLIEFYQLSINMVQIKTPRTFCVLPSPQDISWKKPTTWSASTFRLHLLCEGSEAGAVGDIHFLENHQGYQITQPSEFLQKVLPILSIGTKVFTAAAKIAGSIVGIGGLIPSPQVVDTLFGSAKTAKNVAHVLDQVYSVVQSSKSDEKILEMSSDPKKVSGPALRALETFLNEHDPTLQFGGLRSISGPDGRWAWVCEKHSKL